MDEDLGRIEDISHRRCRSSAHINWFHTKPYNSFSFRLHLDTRLHCPSEENGDESTGWIRRRRKWKPGCWVLTHRITIASALAPDNIINHAAQWGQECPDKSTLFRQLCWEHFKGEIRAMKTIYLKGFAICSRKLKDSPLALGPFSAILRWKNIQQTLNIISDRSFKSWDRVLQKKAWTHGP